MTETWLILQSPADSAAWNMALDEALLRTAPDRDCPLLRVYSWRQPAVSIGYFQKFPAHLAEKYEIVRRPTGGGLVYHGDGVDTTYTVVVPQSDPLYKMNTAEAYCAIHQAVAAAVEFVVGRPESFRGGASVASISHVGGSRPTIEEKTRRYECFQNPVRGDVVDDGRKLAGGAAKPGGSIKALSRQPSPQTD